MCMIIDLPVVGGIGLGVGVELSMGIRLGVGIKAHYRHQDWGLKAVSVSDSG
jgi:hypothetical protein